MKANVWRLNAYPEHTTDISCFRLTTDEITPLQNGEALVQVGIIGFNPSLRFRMTQGGAGLPGMNLGDPIIASGVGMVLESKREGIAAGDYVYGDLGWCDYAAVGPKRYLVPIGKQGQPLINPRGVVGELSPYTAGSYVPEDFLGALGGAGAAAYTGLFPIGAARAGETVVVTAAAGGIGLLACQLAQIAGLNVVGTTRSAQKADWLRTTAGIANVVELTPERADTALAELPPNYDVLFENVGGPLMKPLLDRMKKYGRVILCGLISEYEEEQVTQFPLATLVFKDIQIAGYFADDYLAEWGPAFDRIGRWLMEGKLSRLYDVARGLENAPETYLRLYRGATNRGKLMLRIAEI